MVSNILERKSAFALKEDLYKSLSWLLNCLTDVHFRFVVFREISLILSWICIRLVPNSVCMFTFSPPCIHLMTIQGEVSFVRNFALNNINYHCVHNC